MNKSTTDKIAEMIKERIEGTKNLIKKEYQGLIINMWVRFAKDLADYFEEESITERSKFSQMDARCPSPFNKTQFLKDCGVQ